MRFCSLSLLAIAVSFRAAAQPLGADPSIQAPGTTLKLGVAVTVNLFGSLPPWEISLVDIAGSTIEVIGNYRHATLEGDCWCASARN